MHFNFFAMLRNLVSNIDAEPYVPDLPESPGLPIHPSASDLAEQMLVDPEVLKNETYEPGLFDEEGDYYPQYTDDPSQMPEYFEPAPLDGGDTAPESSPADNSGVSSGESKESE